jgi:hypothetical protein
MKKIILSLISPLLIGISLLPRQSLFALDKITVPHHPNRFSSLFFRSAMV